VVVAALILVAGRPLQAEHFEVLAPEEVCHFTMSTVLTARMGNGFIPEQKNTARNPKKLHISGSVK